MSEFKVGDVVNTTFWRDDVFFEVMPVEKVSPEHIVMRVIWSRNGLKKRGEIYKAHHTSTFHVNEMTVLALAADGKIDV